MAVNFPQLVYGPCYATFARPIVITPIASQPGVPPYPAREIFDTDRITLESLDGAIFSKTRTVLDILELEYDRISIAFHEGVRGGEFVGSDRSAAGNTPAPVDPLASRTPLHRLNTLFGRRSGKSARSSLLRKLADLLASRPMS
jgi:hypothetical protein